MDWRVIQGDSLVKLAELESSSLDGVICDPPYSSGGAFRSDRTTGAAAKYLQAAAKYEDFAGDNRDARSFGYWCTLWLAECWRVCREGSPIGVWIDWRQLPMMTDALQAGGWIWRGIAGWDKTEAARPNKRLPRQQLEFLVWGSKGPIAPYEGAPCLPGVWREYLAPGRKHHPTSKTLDIHRDLMGMVVPGGRVLDPFAGSGVVGVAARLEERGYLGIELSEYWADYARERIATEGRGDTMVDRGVVQAGLFGEGTP